MDAVTITLYKLGPKLYVSEEERDKEVVLIVKEFMKINYTNPNLINDTQRKAMVDYFEKTKPIRFQMELEKLSQSYMLGASIGNFGSTNSPFKTGNLNNSLN